MSSNTNLGRRADQPALGTQRHLLHCGCNSSQPSSKAAALDLTETIWEIPSGTWTGHNVANLNFQLSRYHVYLGMEETEKSGGWGDWLWAYLLAS